MTLVYSSVKASDILSLESKGYVFLKPKNSYELLRLQNEFATLILYSSGKLVVQTKQEYESKIEKLFKKFTKLERESFPHKQEEALKQNVIGSDEALKGDSFGGLIVASFYCKEEDTTKLEEMGVQDSKLIDDEKIQLIAEQIEKEFPDQYYVYELLPQDYNDLLSIETLTKVLNDMHNFVGSVLKRKFSNVNHIVDEFPGCIAGDSRVTKAESKYIAVATASILARSRALKQIQELSEKAGFDLHLGSTHVAGSLKLLKSSGLNPAQFCKLHFKNVQKGLEDKPVPPKPDEPFYV